MDRYEAIHNLHKKNTVEALEEAAAHNTLAILAAASPSPADEELEAWLDLWGNEVADAFQEALRNAMSEIEPTEDQTPGSLTSSAQVIDALIAATSSEHQRVAVRCLTDKQKLALKKSLAEWTGTIEAPLEQVVLDTYNNAIQSAGLSEKKTTWGVVAPADIYDPQGLEHQLETRSQAARILSEDEKRVALQKANKDVEYWTEQTEHYAGLVENDLFEDDDARNFARSYLRRSRELAGLEFDPSIAADSPGYSIYNFTEDGKFYYTRANRVISEEQGILNGKLEEIQRDIDKLDRQLKAKDQKNLKDYTKLEDVFRWGTSGGRTYVFYQRARNWRALQQKGLQGGFKTFSTSEAPLSSVADDVTTLFSKSKTIGEGDRAVAKGRIERFLRANVPEATDTKIRRLLNDKHFLQALGNPAILATEIKSEGVGVHGLAGTQMRKITDRGVDLARLTIPDMVRQIDDAVCNGATFEEAVKTVRERQLRIAKDVSNSVMNDSLEQIALDPYLNSVDVDPPTKIWVTALINSRAAHIAANGQKRLIRENFLVGGESAPRPLSMAFSAKNTANCRCRMKIQAFRPDGEPVHLSVVD